MRVSTAEAVDAFAAAAAVGLSDRAALESALGAALLNPARNATDGGPLVGKPAPAFTLESLDGAQVSLASLQGRPVVLNFWASWCVPCREEAPLFRELGERRGGEPERRARHHQPGEGTRELRGVLGDHPYVRGTRAPTRVTIS